MAWPPIVILRLVVGLGALLLAALTLRAAPRAFQNRVLAAFIALHAAAALTSPIKEFFEPSFTRAMWSGIAFRVFPVAAFPLLLTIAGGLGTPLGRPFARGLGRVGPLIASGAIVAWGFLFPGWTIGMAQRPDGWEAFWLTPVVTIVLVAGPAIGAYTVLVALQAARGAPRRSAERARATSLLIALGLLNATLTLHGSFMLGLTIVSAPTHMAYMETPFFRSVPLVYTLCVIAGLGVLVYGMLRLQLFDIDLRVKWTIRRGTLVAIAVATIVIVAELAQIWVSSTLGVIAGVVVALALIFVKRPLERAAQRVADAAMPHVQDTPEWRDDRKGELYQTAVRLALADGTVNDEKERHLAALASQLGLDAERASGLRRAIENPSL